MTTTQAKQNPIMTGLGAGFDMFDRMPLWPHCLRFSAAHLAGVLLPLVKPEPLTRRTKVWSTAAIGIGILTHIPVGLVLESAPHPGETLADFPASSRVKLHDIAQDVTAGGMLGAAFVHADAREGKLFKHGRPHVRAVLSALVMAGATVYLYASFRGPSRALYRAAPLKREDVGFSQDGDNIVTEVLAGISGAPGSEVVKARMV